MMELQTAKGVRDFPPEKEILRQKVVQTIKEVFEIYGFSPLETPILERFDVLASKYAGGAEILRETFKLTDQGGRQLGLRYDLTVPLARFVGMNPTLKMPLKRYQLGAVFRDGPIKKGRYRQFYQIDADTIGVKGVIADAELINLTLEVFKKLKLNAIIKVNNRKLLNEIIRYCKVAEEKTETTILSIDKLEKLGLETVKKELKEKGISPDCIKKIVKIISIKKSNKETIKELKKILPENEGLKEIEELFTYINSENVQFDVSLARGLTYYTGTIFEAYQKKGEIKSSIAAGGRYDKMIGQFLQTKKEIAATGISFGIDILLDTLKGKVEEKSVTKIYVIPIKTLKESQKILEKLRNARIKTDIDLIGRGLSKNLEYANAMKIPYTLLIGQEELKKKKVKLRDMKTGKETMLTTTNLIKKFKKN